VECFRGAGWCVRFFPPGWEARLDDGDGEFPFACNIPGGFLMMRVMHRSDSAASSAPSAQRLFVTTRWSVVLRAQATAQPSSREALETLCRTYWHPLYVLTRSLGHSPADAQDLTQEFFARLLAKDYLRVVRADKGRFRTFLRVALKRFLANEWDRRRAQKRGGGQPHLPFDTTRAEQQFQSEPAGARPPEHLYDRHWALTLLAAAEARLEREYAAADKTAELRHLKPHLTAGHRTLSYSEIATALHTTEGAARVAVHRLRKRFREIFRETIADTVSAPEELDGEFRYVMEILAAG
jgi:RNA polymerase sigma factor (sigma-70 family)